MENRCDNIDTGFICDGGETQQNYVVVESIPQYSQSDEHGLFLHHLPVLRNTQTSPQAQQTNQLHPSDTYAHQLGQIQESNFEFSPNTILPSNYVDENEKSSSVYVISSASSGQPKDEKASSKEFIVLKQYSGASGCCLPSAKISDNCSNNGEDSKTLRSACGHKSDLGYSEECLKHLQCACNMRQKDDGNNTQSSKDKKEEYGSLCMPINISNGTNNHQVINNEVEVIEVITDKETISNNDKKCNKFEENHDEIGIDSGMNNLNVTGEVTVNTDNQHICVDKERSSSSLYTCGCCDSQFVTLCKLHNHFEKLHSTGSYIFFQNTKLGFPRLENISKLTQTDLIEVDQTCFENTEAGEIDYDSSDFGFDGIPNEHIEKVDGTTETVINDSDNFENVTVSKPNDRKKKKKVKNKSKDKADIKHVLKKKECSSLKILVKQKKTVKSKSRKLMESKPDKNSLDNLNDQDNLNNIAVEKEMYLEGENTESQSELAFSDSEKESSKIMEGSDKSFTSINHAGNSKANTSKEKVPTCKLKRKQNEISKVKDPGKKLNDDDKNAAIYKCNICATKYVSKVKLNYHLNKVHKKAKNDIEKQCRWCGLIFPGSKSYVSHMRQCVKNEYLMCLICNTRFDSRNKVNDHLLMHRSESELKCRVCGRTFTCAVTMQSHLRRHNLRKDLQCEHCGKSFYYHNQLNKHKLYCNREPDVECPHCDVKFKTQESLKHHMSVHSNNRPFVCHVCGYAGKKSMYLKRHLRSHTGERPYICSDCGMSFAAANGLNRHRKTHTNEKPCICQYCGKSFTNNWNLKTHLRQHTGDTPYQCRQCDKAFKQNVLLKLHVKSHHSAGSVIG